MIAAASDPPCGPGGATGRLVNGVSSVVPHIAARRGADVGQTGQTDRIEIVRSRSSSSARAQVLIAGGGFAALEAALALRALAGDRMGLTLLSPDPVFRYRPAATLEPFDGAPARCYDLRTVARDLGARYHPTRIEAVASEKRTVRLASGARLSYDALVLAIGARATASVPGALMFRDQRDVPMLKCVLRELDVGAIGRLAFVVPSGSSWALPLYELALLSAARVQRVRVETAISVVSPETEPLAMFGAEASRQVADLLIDAGVQFIGNSVATAVRRDGSLRLQFSGELKADRVVTAPQLRAHRITGVPARWWGFVPTDTLGRVEGLKHVYAAGDMTTFPIKQGGLAAQQADRIAHTIAASLGAPVKELHTTRVLQARLVGAERQLMLRTELDWQGRPTSVALELAEMDHPSSEAKVFGRYLTPYLESLRAPAHDQPTAAWA
jgi:sulfide:quinone oxidoreductase